MARTESQTGALHANVLTRSILIGEDGTKDDLIGLLLSFLC